ncbi:MAG: heavy metal translocating P-type ATPase [Planctomycetota bacterium]|jgi:Cu+-exporting ATPase
MTVAPAPKDAEEIRLRVSGMDCAGCAASIQRALEARPDVHSAAVSFTEGLATVVGEALRPEALVEAVRGRGFDAEPLGDEIAAPAELRSEIELRQAQRERQWRNRAVIGLGIWFPMAIVHWGVADAPWKPWFLLAGATIVIATAGWGFYRSAAAAARRLTTNMDTLIAMGATTAYLFSLVVLVAQRSGTLIDQPLYFSEAAALLGLISLGHWLEARASAKAGSAVRELLELQPDQAEVLGEDGSTQTIPSAQIEPGQNLLIRPGARVPVDGVAIEGETEIDEAVVTGESLPVRKAVGDQVVAGSMNTTGRLVVEATVDGRHTTVARIAEIVQRAQASKARIQRLADRVCAVFVPAVLSIAAVTLLVWWLVVDNLAVGIVATVTVLIISCPCALGLATPMAVMVGAGSASRRGILIKSAAALEQAGRTRQVVFDKTGTLTQGRPAVTQIDRIDDSMSDDEMLRLAAAVEAASEHPIARAVVSAAAERDLELPAVSDFKALPGRGVMGTVNGRLVEVGRSNGAVCRVTVDGREVATLSISDAVRDDAADAVRRLQDMGVAVTMLSGDRRGVAEAVGRRLGLPANRIQAEATPESKCDFVRALPPGAVMVGDGINDAAALVEADLGIAMASGTNIAIESADVVIPGDHVLAVPQTLGIARETLTTIKQNLFFAFFYNAVAIPVAALGLLGTTGPLFAAAAMGLSDLTVIGNAIRLKGRLAGQSPESHGSSVYSL